MTSVEGNTVPSYNPSVSLLTAQKTSEQNCLFSLVSPPKYPLCVFRNISSYCTVKMLLSALCCNCRVHCDLRHRSWELLCLGGLWNPHRANLTLVGVVLSHELSFHFYFSIFRALMVGIGILRVASWIIKQRTSKKNARGWFCLFCYLKDIWPIWWFFRGLSLSAMEWKVLSSALTHINRPTNCVVPRFAVVWGRKSPVWISGFDRPHAFLTRAVLAEKEGWPPSLPKGSLGSAPSAGRRKKVLHILKGVFGSRITFWL